MKLVFRKKVFKLKQKQKKKLLHYSKIIFWFMTGAILSLSAITSIGLLTYKLFYNGRVYPGVYVNNVDFSGKDKQYVENYFSKRNQSFENSVFTLKNNYGIATVSAKEINFGFDGKLSADQAYIIGRSGKFLTDLSIILQANLFGLRLPVSYKLDEEKLNSKLEPVSQKVNKDPVNAVFKFENNRVTVFRPSEEGRSLDIEAVKSKLLENALNVTTSKNKNIIINVSVKPIRPEITTESANNLGIKELIGEGHSLFYHSIPSRIHNVNLAASRINGVLIAPDETFSFDKALGDVSVFTGYQQAYIIQNGKTVLGDGGGVCQVSTTFFRAVLDAGLPIVERHAHAYRVGYYEENSPPGIDATIYVPSVDLKVKNDTGHYILVQSVIDLNNLSLDFYLYGVSDGRKVTMTNPVVSNIVPAPPPLYQDDPTLPKGQTKQTDFAANGANVSFTRTVTKGSKVIISDTFTSNYRPWQAIYMVGTKE